MSAPSTCALPYLAMCVSVFLYAGAARIPFRSPLFMDENSLSPVAKYGASSASVYDARNWARIKHIGPTMSRVIVGGQMEVECVASGSPPPTVQWYRDGEPFSQGFDESNGIGGLRIGTVKSRLVIDCITPQHQGSYTCVAISGTEKAVSPPSLIFVQSKNASGLLPSCTQSLNSPPRVLLWSLTMMETIGNDVTLPCVTSGSPQPEIYWIDVQDRLISRDNPQSDTRYKILENGDLKISAVRWADMGYFSCVAESPLGRDTATTFLYPMTQDR